MSFYKGISLEQIVHDVSSSQRWSGSRRAYELFGNDLSTGEHKSTELPWISLMYNPNYPCEVYAVHNVQWTHEEFMTAKAIVSSDIEIKDRTSTRNTMRELGLIKDPSEDRKKAKFLMLLEETNGSIMKVCKATGIVKRSYDNWMIHDADFRDRVMLIRESIKDSVESALIQSALDGDSNNQRFFLERQARDRGYGKHEATNQDSQGHQNIDLTKLTTEEQEVFLTLLHKVQVVQIG